MSRRTGRNPTGTPAVRRPRSDPPSRREWAILALLLAATILANLPALGAPFVFDEENGIAANRSLRPASPWSAALSYRYSPDQARPLFFASLLLDAKLWGTGPRGFRTVGLVLHLAAGILLYILLQRPPGSPAASLAGTALFLLHPLQAESVLYIWGRSEILATLLLLAALVLAMPRPGGAAAGAGPARWAGALACAALAFAAKEEPIILPVVAFLWWIAALRRPAGEALRAGALFLLPAAGFLIVRAASLGAVGRQVFVRSLADNLLGQAVVTLRLALLVVWPFGQSLDHDARVPDLFPGLLAAGLCLIIAAAAADLLRRGPATHPPIARDVAGEAADPGAAAARLGGGILIALAGTAIYWLVPLPDLMCERRAYLPLAGVALALSGIVLGLESRLASRTRGAWTPIFPLLVAIALTPLSCARALVWSSPERLWGEAARRAPDKARPLVNLGVLAARAGDRAGAVSLFDRAVGLDPGNAEAQFNRGRLRYDAGDLAGAREDFEAALAADPTKVGPRINLAAIALKRNDSAEAERDLRAALALDPGDPRTLNNLAEILRAGGRRDEAILLFRRALAADPGYARSAARLGVVLEETGDRAGALAAYREYLARGAESPLDRDSVLKKIAALEGAATPAR